jgi:fucose 4-O-acetylase-like acetyltransferase
METEKKKEYWMTSKWRPMMDMTYMATIIFDFILGPILYNILQYWNPGQAVGMWVPLTLQGGGLYHISMGAILGIAAFTRGKEKIAEIEAGK